MVQGTRSLNGEDNRTEEESKLSNLMDTKGKVKNLKTELKVQVCFQHHHGKLLSK